MVDFALSDVPLRLDDEDSPRFKVHSDFEPAGDQPKAIADLSANIEAGDRFQTLLGITGSGKSATRCGRW